jgi:hypothetical protein
MKLIVLASSISREEKIYSHQIAHMMLSTNLICTKDHFGMVPRNQHIPNINTKKKKLYKFPTTPPKKYNKENAP